MFRIVSPGVSNPRSRNGSILILVLSLSGMLALLTASVLPSVRTQSSPARDRAHSLRSSLAAESALEYGFRQLVREPSWTDDGSVPYLLENGTSFRLRRLDVPNPDETTTALILATGSDRGPSGESTNRLATAVLLEPSDFLHDKAIVALGEKIEIKNSILEGNVLLGNDNDLNFFWEPGDEGGNSNGRHNGWYNRKKAKDPKDRNYKFKNTEIRGSLFSRDTETFKMEGDSSLADLQVSQREILTPGFDLSFYEAPSDLIQIFEVDPENWQGDKNKDYKKFFDLDLDKTAVFIVERGEKVEFTDCTFRGGFVVVEKPKDWFKGEPKEENRSYLKKDKTKIEFKGVTRIGGGDGGASSSLGILAPTARIKSKKDWTT